MNKGRMVLLALGIGLAVVGLTSLGFSAATGRPLEGSLEIYLFQLTIVSLPFLVLAMGGVRARRPWLVGLLLTGALWGYYLFEGIRYQLSGDRSGANIGLGLLLLASPLLISIACIATHAIAQRRRG